MNNTATTRPVIELETMPGNFIKVLQDGKTVARANAQVDGMWWAWPVCPGDPIHVTMETATTLMANIALTLELGAGE